jgi:DNA-binding GntR family transcriptional regulator
MVEVLAAEWAMPSLNNDDFVNLEQIVEEQRLLIESERFLDLVREDKKFHEYMVHRSGHSRLLSTWSELMGQWEVMVYRRLAHDPQNVMTTVLPDHAGILRALRAGALQELDSLHREINVRVGEQMKAALRDML